MIMNDQGGRPVVIRQLEPFEVCSLCIWFLCGALWAVSFNDYAPRSLRMYPGAGGEIFAILLVIGSFTALAGIARSKTIMGLRLELAGLGLLAPLGLAYVVWTPFSVGRAGVGFALSLGALLAIPSAWLALRIRRYLKDIDKALEES